MFKKINKLCDIQNKNMKPYISKSLNDIEFLDKTNFISDINLDVSKENRILYLKNMNINKNNNDLFQFDELFAIQSKQYNPIKNTNLTIYDYYYNIGVMDGMIIHPKQILTLYPNSKILIDNNNIIYIEHNYNCYILSDFIDKFIITLKIQDLINCVQILEEKNNNNNNELLLLFHAGYINVADGIIDDIINSNLNKKSTLSINFNNNDIQSYNSLIIKIKKNFNSYYITTTPNFGNDIVPSILVYQKLKNKINVNYILKLHTKQSEIWRNKLINLFLDRNIDKLINILKYNKQIFSVGNIDFLYLLQNDKFNKVLLNKIYKKNQIHEKSNFFAGTIFLCKTEYFNMSINKINSILKSICLLPFYYDNYLFWSRSPVHTAERIFGITAFDNYKYNLGINFYENMSKCCIYASHIKNHNQINIINYNIKKIINNVNLLIFVYSSDIEFNINDIANNPNILFYNIENIGLDFSKYVFGLNILNNNNMIFSWYLLINDSILFSRNIDDIFNSINYLNYNQMISIIDSNEVMLHYQSFFWILQKNICDKLIEKYRLFVQTNDMNNKEKIIEHFEIQFSNDIINNEITLPLFKYGSFNLNYIYKGVNPNFIPLLKQFIIDTGFPILKVKLITCEDLFPTVLIKNNHIIKYHNLNTQIIQQKKFVIDIINFLEYNNIYNFINI
jgi:hypothetical protein